MGKEAFTETKNIKVRIFTIDGNCNVGLLNILGYERLSDYLQKFSSDFIMLYNSGSDNNRTLFILKKNILTIEEVKEEQSISWSCGPYFWIGFSCSNAPSNWNSILSNVNFKVMYNPFFFLLSISAIYNFLFKSFKFIIN